LRELSEVWTIYTKGKKRTYRKIWKKLQISGNSVCLIFFLIISFRERLSVDVQERKSLIISVLEPMVNDCDGFFKIPLHMLFLARKKKKRRAQRCAHNKPNFILPKEAFDKDDSKELLHQCYNEGLLQVIPTYKEPL
jgi:hypothetical protein